SAEQALQELDRQPYDVVLSDIRMPKLDGLALVDEIRRRGVPSTVILMSAFGSLDVAVEAMKRGAYDYIAKPFKPDEVILVLRKAEERERLYRENQSLRRALEAREPQAAPGLVYANGHPGSRMDELLRTVLKIA